MDEHTYAFCTPLCCSSWGHQTAKRTQQPSVTSTHWQHNWYVNHPSDNLIWSWSRACGATEVTQMIRQASSRDEAAKRLCWNTLSSSSCTCGCTTSSTNLLDWNYGSRANGRDQFRPLTCQFGCGEAPNLTVTSADYKGTKLEKRYLLCPGWLLAFLQN